MRDPAPAAPPAGGWRRRSSGHPRTSQAGYTEPKFPLSTPPPPSRRKGRDGRADLGGRDVVDETEFADPWRQHERDAPILSLLVARHRRHHGLDVDRRRQHREPERNSRSGRVRGTAGSTTTRRGWWNAPIMFLPSGWSIAVLPPMEASTCASTVVGSCTKLIPRM